MSMQRQYLKMPSLNYVANLIRYSVNLRGLEKNLVGLSILFIR